MQKKIRFKISANNYNASTLDAESVAKLVFSVISKIRPEKVADEAARKVYEWAAQPRRQDDLYNGNDFVVMAYVPNPANIVSRKFER